MRAAAAADDGQVRIGNSLEKVQYGAEELFFPGRLIIGQHTLEEGHGFICLHFRIFIGRDFVFQRDFDQVAVPASAGGQDIFGKTEVSFLLGQAVEGHERFQDGTRIDPAPVIGGFRYCCSPRTCLLNHSVCMPDERGENPLAERFFPAYFQEMHQPRHDVFPAPQIPACQLTGGRIGGNPAVGPLGAQECFNRAAQKPVQRFVSCCPVAQARAAHHFAPVLAPPAPVPVIGIGVENAHEILPGFRDQQLTAEGKRQIIPINPGESHIVGSQELKKVFHAADPSTSAIPPKTHPVRIGTCGGSRSGKRHSIP